MNAFKVQNNSSLLDVCLQVYGSLDYLSKLITDNNLSGFSDTTILGKTLIYDTTLTQQSALFNKNLNSNTIYATVAPIGGGNPAGAASFENASFDNSFENQI